jgi:hypothetical protein
MLLASLIIERAALVLWLIGWMRLLWLSIQR